MACYNREAQENMELRDGMKTIVHIILLLALLPLWLIGLLASLVLKLAEAIGELWQRTGDSPEHGMYATMAIKMK